MSHEKWLATGLSLTVLVVLSLIVALTLSLGWDWLLIATLLFVISFPIIWLGWYCYHFWCQVIRQLTIYTQVLKEGTRNLHFKKQHPDNLLLDLQREINSLANVISHNEKQTRTLDNLLSQILDAWSVPVCLFDHQLKLIYRNSAINEQIQQPMLLGTSAADMGFREQQGQLSHDRFDQKWQCQTINYSSNPQNGHQQHRLFTAFDISQPLNQKQIATQQNLIRVLSHEIRNSLTPMSSMTDTLLSNKCLDEQQTRLVLSRINQRSDRLLSFIGEYSKLSQLPPAKMGWFELDAILDEAKLTIDEASSKVEFRGNQQCFADAAQIAQLMVNLFKNAQEANDKAILKIWVKSFITQDRQIIEVNDNGPGFANLENVLTPFYTTKQHGSGIGLTLCEEIARNHGGQLKVKNSEPCGATITMSWPIEQTR